MVIDIFNLDELSVDTLDSTTPLFDNGVGLDSIDALELSLALKKTYAIPIDANSKDLNQHFYSIASLAGFIQQLKNQ
jgi:acyl carrier protein